MLRNRVYKHYFDFGWLSPSFSPFAPLLSLFPRKILRVYNRISAWPPCGCYLVVILLTFSFPSSFHQYFAQTVHAFWYAMGDERCSTRLSFLININVLRSIFNANLKRPKLTQINWPTWHAWISMLYYKENWHVVEKKLMARANAFHNLLL